MKKEMSWIAAPTFQYVANKPLNLATLSSACGVRNLATDALDQAGLSWREVFVGGGVSAVSAAINAGLAATVLARRLMPVGAIDIGDAFGLPSLPNSKVTVKRRRRDHRVNASIDLLLRTFQGTVARRR